MNCEGRVGGMCAEAMCAVEASACAHALQKDPRYDQLMSFLKEKLDSDALAEKLEDTWDDDEVAFVCVGLLGD